MRLSFETLKGEFFRVLTELGFSNQNADLCSRLFAETSLDGVYSHGVNRFPSFVKYVKKGLIKIDVEPEVIHKDGVYEVWDGKLGAGNINAYTCMNRAIELAKKNSMACIAIKNTNHWLRGGSYGWQAADAGCMAFCFTNTIPNMPPWGGKLPLIGNNPLVLAAPRSNGNHLVLDMAMSQYSYGKLNQYKMHREELSFFGGYNSEGKITTNPTEILESKRLLPTGMWKGSGLSIMLDLFCTLLSGGKSVEDIGAFNDEFGVSQVFICFHIKNKPAHYSDIIADKLIQFIHQENVDDQHVFYPGERTLQKRTENKNNGIPVDEMIWKEVQSFKF